MILLSAGMVFLSVTLLSSIVLWQYQTVLLEKTFEVCRNLSVNISGTAREELLTNDIYEATRKNIANLFPAARTETATRRHIKGLLNSYVINVDGRIVAHSRPELEGTRPDAGDLQYYEGLTELRVRELSLKGRRVLRFAYPIFVKYRAELIRVGTGVFEFDREAVYEPVFAVRRTILYATVGLLILSIAITYVLSRRLSRPIEDLARASAKIAAGEFGTQVTISSSDEIGQLADSFNKMSLNLREIQALREREAAVGREMEIARDIQLSLLPADGEFGAYSFQGYMRSADEVGGDYYDCLRLKAKRKEYWWFLIGDVSGHGLPAGLITLMAQTAIHTVKQLHPELGPDQALAAINRVLYENIRRLGQRKYMTASIYRADATGAVSSAGLHLDTMIYRAKKKKVDIIPSKGMWLGVEPEIGRDLKKVAFRLARDDVLFLYTDGIVESRDPAGELFGEGRIVEILQKHGHRPLPELQKRILGGFEKFTRDEPPQDDVTFALIRKN